MEKSLDQRVLLFDLGNILVQLNSVTDIWDLAKIKNPPAEKNQLWATSQAVQDYESGRIDSMPGFYAAMARENPLRVSFAEFSRIVENMIDDPFPGTHQLLAGLKKSYNLFLLSNTNAVHWSICQEKHQLETHFQKLFLSYEMGVMKPHPFIYAEVIRLIGIDPQNIWFYDDNERNVIEAKAAGLNAHLSFGGKTLINDLRKHEFIA